MKTTTRYTTTMLTLALLLTLGGCVKDELHDTPHPDTGSIAVTADWTGRGEGVDIPAEWTVTMGGYTGTETGATHSPDYLFNPGSYTLAVYNPSDGITVSGTTATGRCGRQFHYGYTRLALHFRAGGGDSSRHRLLADRRHAPAGA